MIKLVLAATAVAVTLTTVVEALDREKMLEVVGKVHGNAKVDFQYDDVAEDREERKCYGHLTREVDPVCGSNGKKYSNLSMFNFRKCMMRVQKEEDMELVDMSFCKNAEIEDNEHIE